MKFIQRLISKHGILYITMAMLMLGLAISILGVCIEIANPQSAIAGPVPTNIVELVLFTVQALLKLRPCGYNAVQGWGLAISLLITPFFASILIAISANCRVVDENL
jgi:hypothetical protein